jgi:hypothetical protein
MISTFYAVDFLDRPISDNEIIDAVSSLKQGKAYEHFFLLNEYFIDSIDILSSHLYDIFNKVLDSGYFPGNWTEGVIISLHKKGDKNEVNNLFSCMPNIFTSI